MPAWKQTCVSRDRTRPEDWRLVGVSAGAWAGSSAGTLGVPGFWWLGVVAVTVVMISRIPRALGAAAALGLGMIAGYVAGSLTFQQYYHDAAAQICAQQDKVELLVRVAELPGERLTPWGASQYSAPAQVRAIRIGSQWKTSGVQARLSGGAENLSWARTGDLLVVYGKLRTEFWGRPPTIGEIRVESARRVATGSSWDRFTATIRERMFSSASRLPPVAGPIILGMSVGDRQLLSSAQREDMATASLTHLTAISGTHIGLALVALAFVVPGGRLWRPAAMLLFLTFLVGVVGPTPSVVRATGMSLIAMATFWRRRPGQPQVALFLVVLVLTLVDPWISTQPGFVMSVLATAGILSTGRDWAHLSSSWAQAKVPEKWEKTQGIAQAIAKIAAASAAASLWVLPALVSITGAVPLWSVLANVLAAPAVAPVTILGIGAAAVCSWFPFAANVLLWMAVPFATWISWVARSVAAFPAALLPWPSGAWGTFCAAALVGLVAVADGIRKKRGDTRGTDASA